MLPSFLDYILVQLRKKSRFRPKSRPKFLLTLGPNPARTQIQSKSPAQFTTLAHANACFEKESIFWVNIDIK